MSKRDLGVDYGSYTLDELRDAYRSIDETRFPKRAAWLRGEIERRAAEEPPVEYASEASERFGIPAEEFTWFKKTAIAAQLSALAMVINNLVGLVLGVAMPQLVLGLHVAIGPTAPPPALVWTVWSLLLALLAAGGCSLFVRSKALQVALIAGWFLLGIQIALPYFVWLPSFDSLFALSAGVSATTFHGIAFHPIPLALCFLTLVTLPDRPKKDPNASTSTAGGRKARRFRGM